MPIYEYQCEACAHELEALQKISDAPLQECPSCHAPKLRKKVSAAGFRLKGGGWYETDFKSGGKKNVAGDKDGASSGSAGASSANESVAKSDTAKPSGEAASTTAATPAKPASAPSGSVS